jgi:benzylsuccinate CoA-transferase BbsF subunit
MVSAPYCARLFADYGANVIKVEPPEGDVARRWGPFPNGDSHLEKSGLYFFLNTNKCGVTLDVGTPAGREVLLGLLRQADLFIENNRPGQMREWGLDYASVSKVNPDLVMVSLTPYGQTGPYSDWNGYELNAFHLSATGSRMLGYPDREPLEPGTFAADFFGAVAGASWGLAASYGREQAGGGQHLDVSCAEVLAAVFVGAQCIGGQAQDGGSPRRVGVLPIAPATILPCKDGYVFMYVMEPAQWKGLAQAMGDPQWMKEESLHDLFRRAERSEEIYARLREWTSQHGKWEIMELCQSNANPTTAVLDVAEAAEHPHVRQRGYIMEMEHPVLGKVRDLAAPFRLPENPGGPVRGAPLLGEHDAEVLATISGPPEPMKPPRPRAAEPHAPPLKGVRVANFGWVWAGPVVGQTLSFLGAEVYKIESRARIDLNRWMRPFAGGIQDPERSLQNHACWAGNGSVTINLRHLEGQALARELVAQCDVVVENFGPSAMEKMHLSYEELRAAKPDIVMLSMPATGLSGPFRDVRTYGLTLTSLTGLDSITGYSGGPLVPFENAFPDPYNGVLGAFAVLTALNGRSRTGKGQHIEFSQQEAIMQMVGPAFMDYFLNSRVGLPIGNRHPLGIAAPHGVFPCRGEDRWVSIAVMTEDEWRRLVDAMGGPEWARAPEMSALEGRLQNIEALHQRLAAWTAGFDDYELAGHLQRHGVAAAPVLSVADLLDDPHYRARGTFIEVDYPLGFRETIYGAYVKMSRTETRVRPGPTIGEDNEYVFKQLLGMPEERYRRLAEEEVIY